MLQITRLVAYFTTGGDDPPDAAATAATCRLSIVRTAPGAKGLGS